MQRITQQVKLWRKKCIGEIFGVNTLPITGSSFCIKYHPLAHALFKTLTTVHTQQTIRLTIILNLNTPYQMFLFPDLVIYKL